MKLIGTICKRKTKRDGGTACHSIIIRISLKFSHDLKRELEERLRGQTFRFISDAGVFSKKGIDYGSKVLIEAMDIPQHAEVLDVGCGYGPIGFAAAKLAASGHVTMLDVNSRAVALAKENAKLNGIQNVTILESDLFAAVQGKTFDVVLTNPPIRA